MIDLAAPLPSGGEDLLGLSEDLLIPQARTGDEEAELLAAELPAWLQESSARETQAGVAPALPGDMLPGMADLRFEAITSQRSDEPVTETVGALKNVAGVIRPELLFDGASLQAGQIIDQVIVSDEQMRRVELLRAMLAREAQGTPASVGRRAAMPLERWLITLILLATLVAALTLGATFLPAAHAGAEVAAAYDLVQSLPDSPVAVLAFEYEPDSAAEMQPLAVALLHHLESREAAAVYAISTRPTGPAMARQALVSLGADSPLAGRWIAVGYVAGESRGISGLTIGALPGVPSPLALDYLGQPSGVTAARLADLEPDLIVILTARSDYLRVWIEQAGAATDAPLIAATSAGSAPMAFPYRQSGQLTAVLSGINDAVAYQSLAGQQPAPALITLWNLQAAGGLAAAAMILVGSLIHGLIALRHPQEPE